MALKKAEPRAENPLADLLGKVVPPLSPTPSQPSPVRAMGKRSDPGFVQASMLLEREVKLEAQIKAKRSGLEFSELVNRLLKRYLSGELDV